MRAIWEKIRRRAFWHRLLQPLLLMATGAYALALFLEWDQRLAAPSRQLVENIGHGWYVIFMAWVLTAPPPKDRSTKEPSPAVSGTGVVIATGGAAAIYLARDVASPMGYVVPAVVALLTVVVAFIVYRFASKHASSIGEARFPTT